MRRVVVTGVGPVSSIGVGAVEYALALRAGASGISEITSFDASGFPHRMGGEVRDFQPEKIVRRIEVDDWGRTSLFAAAAARLAVEDAGIDEELLTGARAGAVLGTTAGESQVLESVTRQALAEGYDAVSPERMGRIDAGRISLAAGTELGLTGDLLTLSTACAAGNYALAHSLDLIRTGEADYMVAGGADSVQQWLHAGFYKLGAVAEHACAPFDRDRAGILTAEGGAALFLESLDSARRRGARIYAEVLGAGLNCDAYHMVAPNAASIADCMRLALADAGVRPDEVDYIGAHGTGTPTNDVVEFTAAREVFGDPPPPISSTKSMLGHTMGAASGMAAIAAALGIAESFLPPTINFGTPDPELPGIDPVPNTARPAEVGIAMVNGFAFGGNNAIVVLGRCDD
ncbi:beta-ketoacyl-[acyl-carrier-protein] synthase family protein [Amycolatopsis aidingensis]|uniref:beta-ketoacyl-[acyl-carrier-protein] synthase family protein n=1 Tax=Amycolatopsis aidingensis TaxID=2842453 RepID=UPI001C0BF0CF|nr:beta-ketoacyl-[acyl-carrier-protein] synthase family protein [Amycolatopsis aidingensis]